MQTSRAADEKPGHPRRPAPENAAVVNRQCGLAPNSLAFESDFHPFGQEAPDDRIGVTEPYATGSASAFRLPYSRNETMQQTLLQEKYPVYSLELLKSETALKDADAIIEYLKSRIADHKIAELITTFDHFAHTKALQEGEIAADILDAKHVLFCFGTHLTNAQVMAVRPRSIGVLEKADRFVITFLEAPMPLANQAMESWVKSLARPRVNPGPEADAVAI
jgi:hypothetical protein